ncbi:hypothetical protein Tco_1395726, partial [Tanacetum coccineum]
MDDFPVTDNSGMRLGQPIHTNDDFKTTKLNRHEINFERLVVSSVIGGILSIEARDMDTKLLSASESNNTLARCWFRRNVPVTTFGFGERSCPSASMTSYWLQIASSGWPLFFAVPGEGFQYTYCSQLGFVAVVIVIVTVVLVVVIVE